MSTSIRHPVKGGASEPVRARTMLTRGNSKLGGDIWGFTIPAMITCPGKTPTCEAICYADGFLFRQNRHRYQANWERTRGPGFTADMRAEIRTFAVRTLRIHVGGDFDTAAYVRKWTTIARGARRTTFYFYTRSWRIQALKKALCELASEQNVFATWSEDRDTGPSDMPVGRRCFLCANAADEALVPPGVLVFRNSQRVARKWINHSWVCPPEQGTPKAKHSVNVTCTQCRRCFTPGPFPS